MALLRYLKPVDGLPDPRGSLSSSIPTQAIAEANKEVQKAILSEAGGKRGAYQQYSSTVRSDIGKYACQHGSQFFVNMVPSDTRLLLCGLHFDSLHVFIRSNSSPLLVPKYLCVPNFRRVQFSSWYSNDEN